MLGINNSAKEGIKESMESLYMRIKELVQKNPFKPLKLEEQVGQASLSFERENWITKDSTYKHRYRVRQKTRDKEKTLIRTKDFDEAFWVYFSALSNLKGERQIA